MLQYHKDEHGYWIVSDEMVGKYGPFRGVFIAHQSKGDFPAECLPQEMQTYRYAYGALDSEIFQISEGGLEEIWRYKGAMPQYIVSTGDKGLGQK